MAQMRGDKGNTHGEKLVYGLLSELEDDVIVFSEWPYALDQLQKKPDFIIIHPDWGVTVLEVKDWIEIIETDRAKAKIRRRDGKVIKDGNPVQQARRAAELIAQELKEDKQLAGFAGSLNIAYRYAGLLTHIPRSVISQFERKWGTGAIFGKEDLEVSRLAERLASIPIPRKQPPRMSENQVLAAYSIIAGDTKIVQPNGKLKGVLDREQSRIVHEPVTRMYGETTEKEEEVDPNSVLPFSPHEEARDENVADRLPEEVRDLPSTSHIRLVRGFAGTGKTDVLILRTKFVLRNDPDATCLVTSFNKPLICSRLYPELEHLRPRVRVATFDELAQEVHINRTSRPYSPQKSEGVLNYLRKQGDSRVEKYGVEFLSDEFTWMKSFPERAKQRTSDKLELAEVLVAESGSGKR